MLSSAAVPSSCILASATVRYMKDIVLGEARCPHCGARVFFSTHGERVAVCLEMPEWDSRPFEEGILEISLLTAILEWWKEMIDGRERIVTPIDPFSPSFVIGSVYITRGSLKGIEGHLIRMTSTTARVFVSIEGKERVFDVPSTDIRVGPTNPGGGTSSECSFTS